MRDRRNTSLSISSSSSSNSTPVASTRDSLHEKRYTSPPPLSPTLPPPVTKENVSRPKTRRLTLAIRLLVLACGIFAFCHFLSNRSLRQINLQLPGYGSVVEQSVAEQSTWSDEPSAVMVTDNHGHARWTVSIPENHGFPLSSSDYQTLCRQSKGLRDNIAQQSRLARAKEWRRKDRYYSVDRTFLEVDTAEDIGILPKRPRIDNVCETSLTYVLDAEDASFGKSLLMLWLSYGLAKTEGRSFFIDDSRWAYGRYSTFFAPPPSAGCSQPPSHHIVPCPHSARHLVVSSATLPWSFGFSFEQEFIQFRKAGAEKSHRIFDLLRMGYTDLFQLTSEDALYAESRIAHFKEEARQHAGSVVGIHVRRGDLRPLEYQFSGDYLPLERYATAARTLLVSQLQKPVPESHTDEDGFSTILEYVQSPLLLASDDPAIASSTELIQGASPFEIQKAQERIQLATKAALDLSSPTEDLREPGSPYVKHVDGNQGWEGGFYSAIFFSVGNTQSKPALARLDDFADADADDLPSEEALKMRELIGRGYLLDLAVLGQTDGVVCAVSSATCRVLGVMLGFDAIKEGRWVNVDDKRAWSWDGRR